MDKIELEIIGLSYSQTQTGAYALVLGEKEGDKRRLPIIIGGFEAQAIAIELESMTPSRPLTHDLFKSFADSYEINVKEVIIYNLVLQQQQGRVAAAEGPFSWLKPFLFRSKFFYCAMVFLLYSFTLLTKVRITSHQMFCVKFYETREDIQEA